MAVEFIGVVLSLDARLRDAQIAFSTRSTIAAIMVYPDFIPTIFPSRAMVVPGMMVCGSWKRDDNDET